MTEKDRFQLAANFLVEEHIRIHDKMVPHPDPLKDAIAQELRNNWNEAVRACLGACEDVICDDQQQRQPDV